MFQLVHIPAGNLHDVAVDAGDVIALGHRRKLLAKIFWPYLRVSSGLKVVAGFVYISSNF